ncbi:MAG: hypothetical protein ACKVH0_10155, partial [Alphaproteobacteria bacterium]
NQVCLITLRFELESTGGPNMRRVFTLTIALIGIGLFSAPAFAGDGKQSTQTVVPGGQSHSTGGGCSDEYPTPQASKPSA